ncbi:hypothetical protein N7X57_03095 [Lactiplantibacillus paraplantarum]|uniref:hypothetical protein n=1 Tax=Lactiplantibacillus paraplantarum TaxID=60520 RepID=UPI0005144D4F|nr:hypothetical protein [Lactiplantibacillus paraplantarum]OAX74306.1 hypothetical protein A0U96_07100 [Lactiplantibacillus plantarum]ALO03692.1 hypothetical protein ASU28_04615 [Lactiplantibacillus paraplantarum]KGE75363.1 hypothetical protein HR47_07550 [Lactiplantibacillus paraplantarum]MCW1909452.1 hypothetical protein [Lactiplantibacillus paraplantarum]RDG13832.1 hypothetical protein DQM08_00450 [Lactiplantibacillus paraplantarum]
MDDFQQQINQWSDWQGLQTNVMAFEPLIQQIYASENEPFKTPEPMVDSVVARFNVGSTQIAIFPPSEVAPRTRDYYQATRFGLTRMARLKLGAPQLRHAGFIFDKYQFYYVIVQPLQGIPLTEFCVTAKPLAKSTLGRQIGTILTQLNTEVPNFSHVETRPDDWAMFGNDFVDERTAWLQQRPVTTNQFVHGNLTGDNLIVTSGQLGLQRFSTARPAARQTELVPLILQAFNNDADLLAGFKATYQTTDLASDLLLGLLLRWDGPQQVQQLISDQAVTLVRVQQVVEQVIQ